jgi:putative transcription factor
MESVMRAPSDLKIKIQKGRLAKKITQIDLARLLCVPVSVIHDYETNKGIPTNAFIARLETVLGVKLPRAVKVES